MEDVIEELRNKFIDIREDGWIESYKGRKNNFGRTFENLKKNSLLIIIHPSREKSIQ